MASKSVRIYLDPERLTPQLKEALRGCLSEDQHHRTLTSEQARHMRAVMAANKGVEAQRKRGIWNFQKKRAAKPAEEAETAGWEVAEPEQAVRAQETRRRLRSQDGSKRGDHIKDHPEHRAAVTEGIRRRHEMRRKSFAALLGIVEGPAAKPRNRTEAAKVILHAKPAVGREIRARVLMAMIDLTNGNRASVQQRLEAAWLVHQYGGSRAYELISDAVYGILRSPPLPEYLVERALKIVQDGGSHEPS